MPQGANIPCTEGAEKWLHEHGVLVIPDFIANAGGVICAAMEYQRATQGAAIAAIGDKVAANTSAVLDAAARRDGPSRSTSSATDTWSAPASASSVPIDGTTAPVSMRLTSAGEQPARPARPATDMAGSIRRRAARTFWPIDVGGWSRMT